MLAHGFMRNALWAGLVTAIVCSTLSFFVYLRRLAFVASGIAHGAFAGVAIGLIAGWEPLFTAAAVSLLLGLLVAGISQRGGIAQDSATGIASSAAMALGVVILGLARGYVPDVFGYLFGSILAVDEGLLRYLTWGAAAVLLIVAAFFRPMLFTALDHEGAEAAGLPVAALDYLLLGLISLTVVAAVRLLGIVLASALLVTPAAAAFRVTRNYRTMLALSVGTGLGCTLAGLLASYRWDLAPGATIALCTAGAFALASAAGGLHLRRARRVSVHSAKQRTPQAAPAGFRRVAFGSRQAAVSRRRAALGNRRVALGGRRQFAKAQARYALMNSTSTSASAQAAESGTKSSPNNPEPPLAPHMTVGTPIEQGPPASNDPRP